MSDLEPPEIPMELPSGLTEPIRKEEKKGFFAKLFSKNSSDSDAPVMNNMPIAAPELELPTANNSFDTLSNKQGFTPMVISDDANSSSAPNSISGPTGKKKKLSKKELAKLKAEEKKNKAAAKKLAKSSPKIGRIDESGQFDWTRDIKEQEILIHDSNRSNADINKNSGSRNTSSLDFNTGNNDIDSLMKQANDRVNNGMIKVDEDTFASSHKDIFPNIEPIDIDMNKLEPLPELGSNDEELNLPMPIVDSENKALFSKISSNHGKLRKKLNKVVATSSRLKKDEVTQLLSDYDESVEKHIEDKQLELSGKKQSLDKFEKHLKNKEKAVDDTHAKVLDLHGKLKSKEEEINNIISENVEKELARRLKEERANLRDEIKATAKLNSELERKSKSFDDSKLKLEKEYQKKLDSEQKKLNDMQSTYEKKLAQLTSEKVKLEADKKELESRRSDALKLISQAHEASKELEHINQLKAYIDKNKQRVETEISEDKELKNAILNAEKALVDEKKNLDNLIFSKYIENKLKNIKPENLSSSEDWRNELTSNPLYAQISQCKTLLSSKKINEAKSLYNQIRGAYENAKVSRKEKEALYVAIRELYNDIQLKIVESQMPR